MKLYLCLVVLLLGCQYAGQLEDALSPEDWPSSEIVSCANPDLTTPAFDAVAPIEGFIYNSTTGERYGNWYENDSLIQDPYSLLSDLIGCTPCSKVTQLGDTLSIAGGVDGCSTDEKWWIMVLVEGNPSPYGLLLN